MNDFLPTSAASPTSTPTPPATTATPNAPNVPGGASGGSGSGSGPASQASPPVLPNLTAPVVPPPAPSQPSLSSPMSSSQEPDLRSASLYLNRELSWLEFNARVLAEAENESVPLLERLKFHAIVSSNLDEFFMVRVAGLKTQQTGEVGEIPPDGMTVSEQLSAIAARVHDLVNQQSNSLTVQLLPKLAEQGIVLVKPESLPNDALANLDERFHNEVFPILTPIAIDPGHPFPHVRNKSLNLGVMFMREGELEAGFGVVQVPMMLPRLLEVSGVKSKDGSTAKHAFVLLEALIARHVGTIFPAFA